MLMYQHEERRVIDAKPEDLFAALTDLPGHVALAGSGEVKSIHHLSAGPIGVGTSWDADEQVRFGKGEQTFTAHSEISEYAPPYRLAWRSTPPGHPTPKRIEWTYQLMPTPAGSTEVIERVEVDFGAAMNLLMKLPYQRKRAPFVAEGMRKTLDNLQARAAG